MKGSVIWIVGFLLSLFVVDSSAHPSSSSRYNGTGTGGYDYQPQRERVALMDMHIMQTNYTTATVIGLRIEKEVSYEDGGISVILADSAAKMRLFGYNFTHHTRLRFTTERLDKGADCDDVTSTMQFQLDEIHDHSATATITLRSLGKDEKQFYVCAREDNVGMEWIHQGDETWLLLRSNKKLLPFWAHVTLLGVLLVLSGLFSGLNLGLMAMDRTELKIIEKTGNEQERWYAKKIKPIRNKGNYLLCSLLLGNVLVNSSLTILLDDLVAGVIAVVASTLAIVVFGEIIPQAVCSRYGLAVGANTIILTKITMALTFPLSYPVSFILDKCLGEEIGNVYNRERLRELIRVTENYNDLKQDEVNVIEGVLKLANVTCWQAMTKLQDVFMLPIESVLDFETIDEIIKSGYSRIPIYDSVRDHVVSILYTKDLAFVDPDDRMPIKTVCEFNQHHLNFVDEKKALDQMLMEFKEGNKGHMAFVRRTKSSDESDPYYETVGVITLEDVIEELIQAEISDETDIIKEKNRRKRRRSRALIQDFPQFTGPKSVGTVVSSQLIMATFQFLSTSIPSFHTRFISESILQRLLNYEVFFKTKVRRSAQDGRENDPVETGLIYEKGVSADYFVLILEGRVQACLGTENLVFEGGPFTYFGTQCLTTMRAEGSITPRESPFPGRKVASLDPTFTPDYTVRAITDVTYLKISRSMYLAALQATTLERSVLPEEPSNANGNKDTNTNNAISSDEGKIKPPPYTETEEDDKKDKLLNGNSSVFPNPSSPTDNNEPTDTSSESKPQSKL